MSGLRISLGVAAFFFLLWWFGMKMPGKNISTAASLSTAEIALRAELAADVQTLAGEIGERNMRRYPQLLGIGLDEGTAIVVRGSIAEIIGNGAAHFYDYRPGPPAGEHDFTIAKQGQRDMIAVKKEKEGTINTLEGTLGPGDETGEKIEFELNGNLAKVYFEWKRVCWPNKRRGPARCNMAKR